MDITLNYNTLAGIVDRQLSVIGKRSVDDNGKLLFKDITLGSREKELLWDFFTSAFVDLAAELRQFITAEVENVSGLTDVAYIDWWTDSDWSAYTASVTADGQLLYRYDTRKLYQASLSFPTVSASAQTGDLFTYGGDYYSFTSGSGLTVLSAVQVEALTEQQKAAARPLQYFDDVDPSSLTLTAAGIYGYYNSDVWVSQRSCSFSEVTPSDTTLYYDPSQVPYQWIFGAMQRVTDSSSSGYTLTVTLPDNWNDSLTISLRKSLEGYCVSYALWSWFNVTAPRIAEKYRDDFNRHLGAVIRLVHEKSAPAVPAGNPSPVADVSTEIITS